MAQVAGAAVRAAVALADEQDLPRKFLEPSWQPR
jgi:hypothetical protein